MKELLRFVRHQQQDMTISTVAPTTYLQSLRHNHQKPNVMLNDGSVHRSIPSPRTPPPSAHARAVSPPASNSYTTPFTFNFSNEKAASISHAFVSPRHQRDAQLRALSTEGEKLRSKLAFLEQHEGLLRATNRLFAWWRFQTWTRSCLENRYRKLMSVVHKSFVCVHDYFSHGLFRSQWC